MLTEMKMTTDQQYYDEHIEHLMPTVASANSSLDFSEGTIESHTLEIVTHYLNPENGLTIGLQARDYQLRVICKAVKAIVVDNHKTVLINSPTGSGKTVMLLLTAAALLELTRDPVYTCDVDLDDFLWTCMRHALLEQAEREIINKFPGIRARFKYMSTFATGVLDEWLDTDVLIEDEAQHSASVTSTDKYNKIKPTIHIAATATPHRTDSMKLVFSKVIQDAGLRQLVDQGYLSPYHHYTLRSHEWDAETVAKAYLADPEKWGKSVVFFLNLAKCDKFVRMVNAAGISAATVRGGSFKEQEGLIEDFKAGKLQVLANVAVLVEGFDCPELKSVFVRHGSKSPIEQMAGRGFRVLPGVLDGCNSAEERASAIAASLKPYVNIIQNSKTRFPMGRMVSPEKSFKELEDGSWEEVQANKKAIYRNAQTMTMRMLRIPASPMPNIIKKAATKNAFYQRLEERREARENGPTT